MTCRFEATGAREGLPRIGAESRPKTVKTHSVHGHLIPQITIQHCAPRLQLEGMELKGKSEILEGGGVDVLKGPRA